jgi:hypothetical protein
MSTTDDTERQYLAELTALLDRLVQSGCTIGAMVADPAVQTYLMLLIDSHEVMEQYRRDYVANIIGNITRPDGGFKYELQHPEPPEATDVSAAPGGGR